MGVKMTKFMVAKGFGLHETTEGPDFSHRRSRVRAIIRREDELDREFAAFVGRQKQERDALGHEVWELRKGIDPLDWCNHCAEPVYGHEPHHSAGEGTFCHRHAHRASEEIARLGYDLTRPMPADRRALIADRIARLEQTIARDGDISMAFLDDLNAA
jgi:hypothetical protein